ncbi:hypothetical protein [Kitasatospora sp. NPDC004531]
METLRVMVMRRAAGQIWPEQLPTAAAELLADGYDTSPALVELAGCGGRERGDELEQLWHRALGELGVVEPELDEVERWVLRDVAARVVSGTVELPEVVAVVGGLECAVEEAAALFVRVVVEGCCQWCVAELIDAGPSEVLAGWEAKVRAAAAALSAEPVRVVALRYRAEWVAAGELPMAAAELLAEGHESPALVELAGCGGRERGDELEQLWHRALDELGMRETESEESAGWALRQLAARLGAGAIGLPDLVTAVAGLEIPNGEPELRFRRAVMEGCCEQCLVEQVGVGQPESLAAWEAEVRAVAAALSADGR